VVSATLKARELGHSGERYILCGENLTIKDLFARIAKIAGVKPPGIYLPDGVVHCLGKTGDLLEKFGAKGPVNSETAWTSTLFHWFDHSKATRQLGFNPRPAQQALEESVGWMKTHGII
jgi:dihydroflavonol-4-reductase